MTPIAIRRLIVLLPVCVLFVGQPSPAQYATEWGSEPSIDRISEHVYRWGGGSNVPVNALFIPTDEGIVLIDGPVSPCDGDSSNWIKEELERRYDVPVRYVVLSHDRPISCRCPIFAIWTSTIQLRCSAYLGDWRTSISLFRDTSHQ